VKLYLSEETQDSWLMVLDGLDDLDSKDMKHMKDCIPSSPLGAVLVTTCKRALAQCLTPGSENHLEVTKFRLADTLPLFRNKELALSDNEISDLVATLKGLPIALVQAAAYLTMCPKVTAKQYLEKIFACGSDVINNGILATTEIAFDHIESTQPFAAYLARTTSMFNFQTVPRLLLRYYNSKVEDFCTLMKSLALMDVTTDKSAISVSHLVRTSIKAIRLKAIPMEHEFLTDTLSEKFPSLDAERTRASMLSVLCGILLPYAKAVLQLEANPTTKDGKRYRATLLYKTTKYYAYLKRYESAIQGLKESLKLREEDVQQDVQLIKETTSVLEYVEKLAKSFKRPSAGSKDSAPPGIDHCVIRAQTILHSKEQEAVENQLLKHSEDFEIGSKDTGTDSKREMEAYRVEDALALIYDNKGQHEMALARHEIVHKWCLKQYGAEDLETARQVFKIARNLDLSGNYLKAEAKYREAWKATKLRLGEVHPEASRILSSLATVLSKQGKRTDARLAFENALSLQQNDPGPRHADTLTTKHNYAIFIQGENTSDGFLIAAQVLLEVLQEQSTVLGSDHPDTLRTAVNLARNLSLRGMNDDALKLCRFVLPWQKQKLGLDNPEIKVTEDMIANVTSKKIVKHFDIKSEHSLSKYQLYRSRRIVHVDFSATH
jgi:tetratricopeptide (TPR) repeat protein